MRNFIYHKAYPALTLSVAMSVGLLMGAAPAAPSSGGGGHASAPSAGHAAAPAPAPAAAPHVANSPAPSVHASAPNTANAKPQAALANRHVDHDQHYQTVYGNPWWPNSTGWNAGWYGNGYGNSGYYNDPSYGQTSNTNTAPTQNQDVSQTPTDPTIDANRPTAAARADNAVNSSPAVTSLNDNIQQAQNAFNSDRERILTGLKNDPDYQKAVTARHNAAKNLNSTTRPTDGSAPALAMIDAATVKLNAADDVTKMEEQAIAADPQAAADKQRLTSLVSERDAQEAQIRGH